jgi:antitoxin VapB
MPLNIKNPEVERLIAEVTALTGESKTEAVRKALLERRIKLATGIREPKRERLIRFLEEEVWPTIPKDQLGRELSQEEQDEILGYGPNGV